MMLVILPISDAMIRETRLPDGAALLQAIRESSFDELHGPLDRNVLCGRQQCVEVIGHDDEFVEQEFACVAIVREGFDQEMRGCLASKDGKALDRDGGDEEDAVGFHFTIVEEGKSVVHGRCHKCWASIPNRERWRAAIGVLCASLIERAVVAFQENGTRGLKAGSFLRLQRGP